MSSRLTSEKIVSARARLEDLAIVTGRGDARLINIEALGPYFRDDIHVVGIRANDLEIAEFAALGLRVTASDAMVGTSIAHLADEIIATTTQGTEGLWIHFDADVIDASEMPAVDCPEPGGPGFAEVAALLRHLLQSPLCVGLELTIFDPDLDPDGKLAERLVECLVQAFRRDNAGQCVMRADRLTRSLNSDFGTLKA